MEAVRMTAEENFLRFSSRQWASGGTFGVPGPEIRDSGPQSECSSLMRTVSKSNYMIRIFETPLSPVLFEFDAPAGSFQNSNSTDCDCRIPFSGILAQSGQKSTCTRLEHGGQWFHSDSVVTSIRAEGRTWSKRLSAHQCSSRRTTTSQTWVTRDEALKQQCLNVGNVLIVECSC